MSRDYPAENWRDIARVTREVLAAKRHALWWRVWGRHHVKTVPPVPLLRIDLATTLYELQGRTYPFLSAHQNIREEGVACHWGDGEFPTMSNGDTLSTTRIEEV